MTTNRSNLQKQTILTKCKKQNNAENFVVLSPSKSVSLVLR